MGILDFDLSKITGNDAFMLGMGILGNNQGHYGALGPALGGGLQDYQRQKLLAEENMRRKQQQEWMTQNAPEMANAPAQAQSAYFSNKYKSASDRPTAKDATGRLRYVDDGSYVFNLPEGQSLVTDEIFDREEKFRKEIADNTKEFPKVSAAFGRINASIKDPSPAGDLSLIFNYMKMLDPGSTVREGEFATAQNAGGIDSKVVSLYNSVINGKRLDEPQRADFMKRSGLLYNEALKGYSRTKDRFKTLAPEYNLNPSRVIIDHQIYPEWVDNLPDPYSVVGRPEGR